MRSRLLITILVLGVAFGCGKSTNSTTPQTATLTLKDGTSVTGTVTKSDTSSITVQSSNGVVTTYPMAQVSAVNYGPASGSTQATAPPPETSPQNTPPSAAAAAPPPATAPSPASAAPPQREYHPAATYREIPADTTLEVRTNETIDSKEAQPGQTYSGVVVRDVTDTEGRVAIPHGADATLVVRDANRQGKVQGQSGLAVDVASVSVHGHTYRLETSNFVEQGKQGIGTNKRTAEFTGGGGVLGTIIGAVAGGGKGAAIGALSGAAAGAATQSVTRGKGARIPAETVMSFRLEAPIRIREMR